MFDKKEFFRQNFNRELFSFKSRLGLSFNDDNLLLTAFTHKSYHEDKISDDDNNDEDNSHDKTSVGVSKHNAKLSLLGEWCSLFVLYFSFFATIFTSFFLSRLPHLKYMYNCK